MPFEVQNLRRRFRFDGVSLPDPGTTMTAEQVREHYVQVYPDLVNATLRGPEVNEGVQEFEFTKSVGVKA